jgi:O-acetylserine/cysteine efflux transporter
MAATLTATRNPVGIWGDTSTVTGTTTIAWNTGNLQRARVFILVATPPNLPLDETLFAGNPTTGDRTGSKALTVKFDSTYTLVLRQVSNNAVLATLVVTVVDLLQEAAATAAAAAAMLERLNPPQAIYNLRIHAGTDTVRVSPPEASGVRAAGPSRTENDVIQLRTTMRQPDSTRRRWSSAGLLWTLLAAALWGLAPVATKAALDGYSPEFVGWFRLAVATLLFRALAGPGARWFVADRWVWVAGIGLGMDLILYNYGMQMTSANVAGLVINVEMVSTITFAVWLLGERLNARRLIGSAVTLGGVLVVSLEGVHLTDLAVGGQARGNLLVMCAGISWSLYAVAQRRAARGPTLFHQLTPTFAVAALTTTPPLLSHSAWNIAGGPAPTAMLLVLALLGTGLVYWVYAYAQQLIDVSVLATLLCSIPLFTLVFAYVFLGETLTLRLIMGGLVVIAGIVIIAVEEGMAPDAGSGLTAEASTIAVARREPAALESKRAT